MCAYLPDSRYLKNVPFDAHVELGKIDAHIHNITAELLVHVPQVNLHTHTLLVVESIY